MSEAPTKVASPDMQLAVLISMGFDAESAEQALEKNDWKVGDSIDYLLAAGISMNTDSVVSDDDVKSVERRHHSVTRVRLEPPSMIASNNPERLRTRQETPADPPAFVTGGGTRRHENTQEDLVDEWIPDDSTPPRRTTSHRHHQRFQQRHDGDADTASLSAPNHASRRSAHARRTNAGNEPHSHRGPASVQSVTDEQEIQRYRQQQESSPYGANDPLAWDPFGIKHNNMSEKYFDSDDARTFPGATAVYGVPKYSTNKTAMQSTSRRQVGDDDVSTMAVAGNTVLTASPVNSLEATTASSRTDDPNRKDIRRLYILVCVAIALVIVCTGVAVALVLTVGRNGGGGSSTPDDSNVSTPTTTPTMTTTPPPTTTTSPTTTTTPRPTATELTGTEPTTIAEPIPTTAGPITDTVLPPTLAPPRDDPERDTTPSPTTAGAGRRLELQMDDLNHYLRGG